MALRRLVVLIVVLWSALAFALVPNMPGARWAVLVDPVCPVCCSIRAQRWKQISPLFVPAQLPRSSDNSNVITVAHPPLRGRVRHPKPG